MLEQEMIRQLEEETQEYLANMKRFVELESPSFERKDASDRCCDFLEEKFGGLGFRTRRIPQTECGDHLYGELGSGRKRILIVGHYDTVFPVGTLATMPFHVEGNKAYGPGILDMKGGIMMAYFAIRLLLRRGLMPEGCVGFFFNGDEETGSFHSSDLIIEAARQYENVFVMEPGVDDLHAIKTHRFGRGTYHVIAHGKAAHSGSNSHQAISPLMEIARQLLRVEEWDKELNGSVTLAPTAIEGGEKETCMIPETANFTMDVRYATRELCENPGRPGRLRRAAPQPRRVPECGPLPPADGPDRPAFDGAVRILIHGRNARSLLPRREMFSGRLPPPSCQNGERRFQRRSPFFGFPCFMGGAGSGGCRWWGLRSR